MVSTWSIIEDLHINHVSHFLKIPSCTIHTSCVTQFPYSESRCDDYIYL